MARNDYFVIAYRILEYLYECFKAGEKPEVEMYGPQAMEINNAYWVSLMESLSDEGYIKGICFPKTLGAGNGAKVLDLKITQKGIEFLQEDSNIEKAKAFLKNAKETIPGL
ncbi:MAG: YjcQ family protein [Clostridia bacterium]|nr:YjcQ family protein [Clostridia bacterium]